VAREDEDHWERAWNNCEQKKKNQLSENFHFQLQSTAERNALVVDECHMQLRGIWLESSKMGFNQKHLGWAKDGCALKTGTRSPANVLTPPHRVSLFLSEFGLA